MPLDSALAIATGKCTIPTHTLFISTYIQSSTSVLVDWILVLLPIPSVLRAIMDRKTRISVIGILFLGAR
jgi:hypothetical protein